MISTSRISLQGAYFQVRRSSTYQSLKKGKKSILYWNLFQLLQLAKELKWLPPREVDQLRKTRNTIHPGNYLRLKSQKLVGAKHFRHTTRIFKNSVKILDETLEG